MITFLIGFAIGCVACATVQHMSSQPGSVAAKVYAWLSAAIAGIAALGSHLFGSGVTPS